MSCSEEGALGTGERVGAARPPAAAISAEVGKARGREWNDVPDQLAGQ